MNPSPRRRLMPEYALWRENTSSKELWRQDFLDSFCAKILPVSGFGANISVNSFGAKISLNSFSAKIVFTPAVRPTLASC
jgi:hypothetical protein